MYNGLHVHYTSYLNIVEYKVKNHFTVSSMLYSYLNIVEYKV